MLAGLTAEERARLSLEGYSVDNLRYLNRGDTRCNQAEDARRFANWKACLGNHKFSFSFFQLIMSPITFWLNGIKKKRKFLGYYFCGLFVSTRALIQIIVIIIITIIITGVLGIPFLDVVRVLAAVLLLGNLQFHETNGGGGQCETHEAELKAVAGLLGVTPASLLRGLTMRTHNVRGQLVKSICDANMVREHSFSCYFLLFSIVNYMEVICMHTQIVGRSQRRAGQSPLLSDGGHHCAASQ